MGNSASSVGEITLVVNIPASKSNFEKAVRSICKSIHGQVDVTPSAQSLAAMRRLVRANMKAATHYGVKEGIESSLTSLAKSNNLGNALGTTMQKTMTASITNAFESAFKASSKTMEKVIGDATTKAVKNTTAATKSATSSANRNVVQTESSLLTGGGSTDNVKVSAKEWERFDMQRKAWEKLAKKYKTSLNNIFGSELNQRLNSAFENKSGKDIINLMDSRLGEATQSFKQFSDLTSKFSTISSKLNNIGSNFGKTGVGITDLVKQFNSELVNGDYQAAAKTLNSIDKATASFVSHYEKYGRSLSSSVSQLKSAIEPLKGLKSNEEIQSFVNRAQAAIATAANTKTAKGKASTGELIENLIKEANSIQKANEQAIHQKAMASSKTTSDAFKNVFGFSDKDLEKYGKNIDKINNKISKMGAKTSLGSFVTSDEVKALNSLIGSGNTSGVNQWFDNINKRIDSASSYVDSSLKKIAEIEKRTAKEASAAQKANEQAIHQKATSYPDGSDAAFTKNGYLNPTQLEKYNDKINKLKTNLKELGVEESSVFDKKFNNTFNSLAETGNLSGIEQLYREKKKAVSEIEATVKLEEKLFGTNNKSIASTQKQVEKSISKTLSDIAKSSEALNTTEANLKSYFEDRGLSYEESGAKAKDAIDKVRASQEKVKESAKELQTAMTENAKIESATTRTDEELAKSREKLAKAQSKYTQSIDNMNKKLKKANEYTNGFATEQQTQSTLRSFYNAESRVASFTQSYSRAMQNPIIAGDYKKIKDSLNMATTKNDIASVNKELDKLTSKVKKAGLTGQTFMSSLKSGIKSYASFEIVSRVFYGATAAFSTMIDNVENLNSAMVELRKVSDASETQLSSFYRSAGQEAVNLSSSMQEYIQSTADFSRLGYNLSEAEELAKVANIYYRVGDEIDSIDTASSDIISVMKANEMPWRIEICA